MATYNPSETQYRELQYAFRRINKRLFKGALPNCLLTLQRKPRTRGYMSPAKFESRKNSVTVLDEIAINPAEMPEMTDAAILATLALNMCRVWQVHFGKPGRGRYINKELADRMQVIGMISSSTGKPGGKRTGQHTGGYIQSGVPVAPNRGSRAAKTHYRDGLVVCAYRVLFWAGARMGPARKPVLSVG